MTRNAHLTIGEISQAYGVSLRTLRFYEERKLLTPARVGQSRYYGAADETRLRVILQARRLGFSLAEIAQIIEGREEVSRRAGEMTCVLSASQIEAQIAVLTQRRDMADAAIQELRVALDRSHGAAAVQPPPHRLASRVG